MSKPKTPAYEPEQLYEVSLLKPFTWKGRTMSPMHRHALKGKILAEIPSETIADVRPL